MMMEMMMTGSLNACGPSLEWWRSTEGEGVTWAEGAWKLSTTVVVVVVRRKKKLVSVTRPAHLSPPTLCGAPQNSFQIQMVQSM